MLTLVDLRLLDRLHDPGHSTRPLRWPRWHRTHLPRRRATLALLQQEPRRLATITHCDFGIPSRRGWAEGGIDTVSLGIDKVCA